MTAMLDHALAYANAGHAVFPVRRDKGPYTAHGFKDATTDEAVIRGWWQQHPEAGIGTPTGSGWFVLDVDNERALNTLELDHGPLPPTRQVVTPRPGRHIYLQGDVTNGRGALPDGIDVRGQGGYVLLPPSPHPKGNYEWRDADLDIAPAPAWLLDLLRPQSANGQAPPSEGDIPAQQRNSTLASLAGTMRRRGFHEAAIAAALIVTNRDRCKPPLGDAEVRKIASSISRYPAADDAVASLGELTSLLGLDTIGKRIDNVRSYGRGSNATTHVDLDDGNRIVLDPVGKFSTVSKLTVELALTTGATPKLSTDAVLRVLVLLSKLSEQHESVEIEDRAWELGSDWLRAAAIGEVDMGDQASRWAAFCALERSTAHNVVLVDRGTGTRYVRIGWFAEHVRRHAGVADTVLRAMPSLGWHKCGTDGQIKATRPGFNQSMRFRFFQVPRGWEE
jgi:Bifunctional DNA primase/polymerase, N-terminal/Primase C terminal 1 (PriCT-1)